MLVFYFSIIATVLMICCNILLTGTFPGIIALSIIAIIFLIIAEITTEQLVKRPSKYNNDNRYDIEILKQYWKSFLFTILRCIYITILLISSYNIYKFLKLRNYINVIIILIIITIITSIMDIVIYLATYQKIERKTISAIRNTLAFECDCIITINIIVLSIFLIIIFIKLYLFLLLILLVIVKKIVDKIFG